MQGIYAQALDYCNKLLFFLRVAFVLEGEGAAQRENYRVVGRNFPIGLNLYYSGFRGCTSFKQYA